MKSAKIFTGKSKGLLKEIREDLVEKYEKGRVKRILICPQFVPPDEPFSRRKQQENNGCVKRERKIRKPVLLRDTKRKGKARMILRTSTVISREKKRKRTKQRTLRKKFERTRLDV